MKDVLFKYAVRLILDYVGQFLTPEKVDEGKVLAVAWLRKQSKETAWPIDDELVEIVARSLRVK